MRTIFIAFFATLSFSYAIQDGFYDNQPQEFGSFDQNIGQYFDDDYQFDDQDEKFRPSFFQATSKKPKLVPLANKPPAPSTNPIIKSPAPPPGGDKPVAASNKLKLVPIAPSNNPPAPSNKPPAPSNKPPAPSTNPIIAGKVPGKAGYVLGELGVITSNPQPPKSPAPPPGGGNRDNKNRQAGYVLGEKNPNPPAGNEIKVKQFFGEEVPSGVRDPLTNPVNDELNEKFQKAAKIAKNVKLVSTGIGLGSAVATVASGGALVSN
jgi:hypothetical protein